MKTKKSQYPMQSLSRDEIIAKAACPTCCAYRGEPCSFARVEDPNGRRTYAKQSHIARTMLAKEIENRDKKSLEELALSIRL